MKKILSIVLLITILISTLTVFSACNSFPGGKEGFSMTGDFYNNVGNVLFSMFAGDKSYIPLFNDDTVMLDAGMSLSNYTINGELVEDGNADFDISLMLGKDFDYDYTIDFKAFGIEFYKQCIQSDNEMYINYGDLVSKPLYYSGDGDNIIGYAIDSLRSAVSSSEFVNGEESYKVNGVNIKAKTVSFSLNSNTLNEWASAVSEKLYFAGNLTNLEWHYDFNELMYFIAEEKLHITWKRYYDGNELCREVIKAHDNYSHHITLDVAYVSDDDVEYVELSVIGYDGSTYFDILAASVKKTSDDDNFETNGTILIGDEILITVKNSGNDTSAKGSADINYITNIGEATVPISFSYSGKREGDNKYNGLGLKQTISVAANSLSIAFNGEIMLHGRATSAEPKITKPDKYYDLGVTADIYYFNTIGEPEKENAIGAMLDALLGKNVYYEPIVDNTDSTNAFEISIRYDDGNSYETDGSFGSRYVDLLMSDNYAYKYYFHTNEEGNPITNVVVYHNVDDTMYHYEYHDGVVYDEYFDGLVRNEIRHDIETIIYTEYSETEYETYYSDVVYIYYESGYCEYENRKLVYERYYDYGNNKYTFVFDENGEVELIVILNDNDGSTLYTFVEEISDIVPSNAFDMPDYERVSVFDFFE